MGEVGCLTCHSFRAAGARSHHIRAEDAEPAATALHNLVAAERWSNQPSLLCPGREGLTDSARQICD